MALDLRSEAELAQAIAENNAWLRVSYSSLGTESGCSRKFEFQKLYPQRQSNRDSFAADVGSALHKGYQEYLVSQDPDKALWEMSRAYPYALEAFEEKDFRNLEACVATLDEMIDSGAFHEYELAQIHHPDGRVVPAIEVPFEIRFKGITLPDGRGVAFVGFIDAIMRNRITGAYRTMDIKTHRRTLKDATAQYTYNSQQIPYGLVIEQVANPDADLSFFEVLYYDVFVDLVEPIVTPYEYKIDRESMQEWLMNTVMQLNEIKRYMELDYFPRTGHGCLSWNRPCQYMEVCQSRNRSAIETFILLGEEPAVPRYEVPWIVVEIDPFGES